MAITYHLPRPEEYTPPCSGKPEYTSPKDKRSANRLARVCREQCACREKCALEAEAIRASTIGHNLWGVWGGRVYQIENAASA